MRQTGQEQGRNRPRFDAVPLRRAVFVSPTPTGFELPNIHSRRIFSLGGRFVGLIAELITFVVENVVLLRYDSDTKVVPQEKPPCSSMSRMFAFSPLLLFSSPALALRLRAQFLFCISPPQVLPSSALARFLRCPRPARPALQGALPRWPRSQSASSKRAPGRYLRCPRLALPVLLGALLRRPRTR